MSTAVVVAGGLLAAGYGLRAVLPALRRFFIPGAVVAGFLGFAIVQIGARFESVAALGREWYDWPKWLISVVFAGMLLERPATSFRDSARRAASAGIAAWVIIVGQIVLGLAVTWLILRPAFGTPIHFGQLLEVSWAGGFGSAAAWGTVHEKVGGLPAARDLAIFFAASGLLYGVVSGIVLVNLAARRGWTRESNSINDSKSNSGVGVSPTRNRVSEVRSGDAASQQSAWARRPRHWLIPFTQVLILAAAFGAGFGLKWSLNRSAGAISPDLLRFIDHLPLFMFTLLGGLLVREVLHAVRLGWLINPKILALLIRVAMDFVIVSALASMRLAKLVEYAWPSVILMIVGAVWCAVTLIWMSRRLLPREYWFELGVINYGMATATTAQGMMLLRMIDKDLQSGAAEDYALAAPLSAPFIGGGIVTITLPILLQRVHVLWVILCGTAVAVALYALGRGLVRSAAPTGLLVSQEVQERHERVES